MTKNMGMTTCKACGREFALLKEKRYTASDAKDGFIGALCRCESLYDAFDCPFCGCQNVLQERKRRFEEDAGDAKDNEQGKTCDCNCDCESCKSRGSCKEGE